MHQTRDAPRWGQVDLTQPAQVGQPTLTQPRGITLAVAGAPSGCFRRAVHDVATRPKRMTAVSASTARSFDSCIASSRMKGTPGRRMGDAYEVCEQRPSAQPRATAALIPQGHGLVFTTRYRPVRSSVPGFVPTRLRVIGRLAVKGDA